jgi:hypothetical protein
MSSPKPVLSASEWNATLLVLTNEERVLETALRDIDAVLASTQRQLPEDVYHDLKQGLVQRLTEIRTQLAYFHTLRTD